jgi:hypothetical protein
MSWWPDSGWLRILDVRSSTAASLALACGAILVLAELDAPYLSALPPLILGIVAAAGLLAVALFFARMWDLAHGRWRRRRQRRAIVDQLDTLGPSEYNLLLSQLAKHEQTFNAPLLDDPVVAGLRRKGLLALSSRRGNMFDYPHMIPDFVWAEMQLRWGILEQSEPLSEDARAAVRRLLPRQRQRI